MSEISISAGSELEYCLGFGNDLDCQLKSSVKFPIGNGENITATCQDSRTPLWCDGSKFSYDFAGKLYSSTSTSWRPRGVKRVPRSDLD